MSNRFLTILVLAGVLLAAPAPAASTDAATAASATGQSILPPPAFRPEQQQSKGSVSIAGKRIDYDAYAGTLVVHLKDWDDVPQNAPPDEKVAPAEASMFYVAYFKTGGPAAQRPITFLLNGGPGSATVWLHMGAFGPKRVITADHTHTLPAPYPLVNNEYSLLDASDLVFIDAPGTGFGRVAGKDHDKAFYGVDADARAFEKFVGQFLSKYGRWNSPKYVFGESYGTTRAAALVNLLERDSSIDLNGLILLSQCLNYDVLPDFPELNPGVDEPYELWLPSYAATAWYHHKLPDAPASLELLLKEVEQFASGDYSSALHAGAALAASQRELIIDKLHRYTGLPADYIDRANLRISQGQFQQKLLEGEVLTTGALDTRFSGPTMDPLAKEAGYDPQSAAISAAYVGALNDYVRKQLKFGDDREYRPSLIGVQDWDYSHQPPDGHNALRQQVNVMPDLASAMKHDPNLRVMLNGGYFDLSTPYYEGIYEMRHLQIPARLQANIEYHYYESGHMVYVHEPALRALHDNVADFIRRTSQAQPAP